MTKYLEAQLIEAIFSATQRGSVGWEPLAGQCYKAKFASKLYQLRWIYWYNQSGITLDRQGILLSVDRLDLPFFWGTNGLSIATRVLEEIDPSWVNHFARISNRCQSMVATSDEDVNPPPLHESSLRLLNRMLASTKDGSLSWQRDLSHGALFFSLYNGHSIQIEYLFPSDSNDRPLGSLVAELTIPGVKLRYACGTDGYYLIEEMLAAAFEDRKSALDAKIRILKDEIESIANLHS